jgi:hypothetical protein
MKRGGENKRKDSFGIAFYLQPVPVHPAKRENFIQWQAKESSVAHLSN